jgi:septum site-determining protein MinC
MALLRGKGTGIEVVFADRAFDEALLELEGRLSERPDFYRGTAATAVFGSQLPATEQIDALRALFERFGVDLKATETSETAGTVAGVEQLERRRALRPHREVQLSDSARSLVADFAGARADIAQRRKHGEASVRRHDPRPAEPPKPLAIVEAGPATLYHVGTLRGGQSLQQIGNIAIVGDVNPGAELLATGDILVFGALRGVAHAGAQGDANARIYALDLSATQLRIASCIAADAGERGTVPQPEVAFVRDGKIVITPAAGHLGVTR